MADSDKARIYDNSSENSNNTIPLILSILALLLAVIAVIIGAVSLSQKTTNNYVIGGSADSNGGSSSAQNNDGINNSDDDKIWTMSIGHDASRWEYLDEVSGQIKGFDVDIVNAVCTIANKNCRLVADVYQRCWNAKVGQVQRGGEGLFNGYYDACTAWSHSYVRARTFQFSNPFAQAKVGAFVVKPGNPDGFDWTDIRGKKIGFIDGFVFDEICLAREEDNIQGAVIPTENIVHYNGRDELIAGILAGEVDAGFDGKVSYDNTDVLDVVSNDITSCTLAGFSMMMPKKSRMVDWWNPALERLMATTGYRTICNDLLEQHGHIPGPDPENICIGLKK